MKSIVLCEGKMDAWVIGHYLCRAERNFEVKREDYAELGIKPVLLSDANTQELDYYSDGKNLIAVFAVGTEGLLLRYLDMILDYNLNAPLRDKYARIAVVTDRDRAGTERRFLEGFETVFSKHSIVFEENLKNNTWNRSKVYSDALKEKHGIRFLPLVVPLDKTGAIEDAMLEDLSRKSKADCELVRESAQFVGRMQSNRAISERYIKKRGDLPKMRLGTFLAISNPGMSLSYRKGLVLSVDWDRIIDGTFEKLKEINDEYI